MVDRLVVPVDGSDESWRAFDVAMAIARRTQGHVDVVQIVFDPTDVGETERMMAQRAIDRTTTSASFAVFVKVAANGADVVGALSKFVDREPGSTIVMTSRGRGRSAAVLGSFTDDLLRTTFGPIVVVGPHAEVPNFAGPILVTVDGSQIAEFAVPLAVAWSIEMRSPTWIVQVLETDVALPRDVPEASYTSRLAGKLQHATHHDVQHEVLHGRNVVDSIARFAESNRAALIVSATHGRTGASRLALGSNAAGVVRHAKCPVLLVRPPHVLAGDAPAEVPHSVTGAGS